MTAIRGIAGNHRVELRDGWQFAAAPAGSGPEHAQQWNWLSASLPGTAASALRDAGLWNWDDTRKLDAEDFWWRIAINESGALVLGFDGIATLADVWLDGKCVLSSDNMFVRHEVPVDLHGSHELLIRCRALAPELARKRPRPRWRVPMLRDQQLRWFRTSLLGRTPGWSPACPPIGPWRPVWIERRALHARNSRLRVGLEHGAGVVEVSLDLGEDVHSAQLIVERAGQRVAHALERRGHDWQGRVTIEAPALWWPHTHGEPALYQIAVEAATSEAVHLLDLGQRGFRTIAIERADGDFAVRVNDVPVFCRGACWTPLDVVSLNSNAEAYATAVEQACKAGMNMLRVAGPLVYEDDALLDAMDRCGVLLWQDLMFANMDYPEDPEFVASVSVEVRQQLARLQSRACLALVCGNSEGEQQAAMSGASRELWSPPLFHEVIAGLVQAEGFAYVPSSAHGGAFPHAADSGPSSYYGVGAYLRPLEDARRSAVVFASECLAFANIPEDACLPGGPAARVHHPAWKARSPRDLGAGWDFDDVRDHYVQRLFAIDPAALRASDHERYVALGRVATGEVMAAVFSEWRRARSVTRGGLIWFLRDLWPGAGWGIVDASGSPKPCYYPLRRSLSPIAVSISDEGVNGLVVHVVNDRAVALDARLELSLFRDGHVDVGRGASDIRIAAHSAVEIAATAMLEGFHDLSYAYRFGPPSAQLVRAALVLRGSGETLAEAFGFPAGLHAGTDAEVRLDAVAIDNPAGKGHALRIGCARFAQSVSIDIAGFLPEDNYFHLAPGQSRCIVLDELPNRRPGRVRGTVAALNSSSQVRVEIA